MAVVSQHMLNSLRRAQAALEAAKHEANANGYYTLDAEMKGILSQLNSVISGCVMDRVLQKRSPESKGD